VGLVLAGLSPCPSSCRTRSAITLAEDSMSEIASSGWQKGFSGVHSSPMSA